MTVSIRSWGLPTMMLAAALVCGGCEGTQESDKCTVDADCAGGTRCLAGVCLECLKDSHCGSGRRCDLSGTTPKCVASTAKDQGPADGALPDSAQPDSQAADSTLADSGKLCKDGDTRSCYTGTSATKGVGACKSGTETCKSGKWDKTCTGEVLPAAETCNSKDDDCDGQTDEGGVCGNCKLGTTMACYTGASGTKGVGLCKGGTRACLVGNVWGSCQGEVTPTAEICNNKDDDCDATTDESVTWHGSPCVDPTRKGICQAGTWTCKQGKMSCKQTATAAPKETCANGKDDDCDGQTDETPPCSCKAGSTKACYNGPSFTAGKGICKTGIQICTVSQSWGPCIGEIKPAKETCNGSDDDCDGKTDEEFPQKGWQCLVPNKKGACSVGKWASCSQGSLLCTGPTATTETCNGKDDDCDGYIDNAISGKGAVLTRPCYNNAVGCTLYGTVYTCKGTCKAGQEVCAAGNWLPCFGYAYPAAEICTNNLDEDCDGTSDDGCSGGPGPGPGKKICIPYELRCKGIDVEVCASTGTAWSFREACLTACSNGKCSGGGCVPFTLTTVPLTLRADAKSSCLITSATIVSKSGTPVPDGTLFTISSNKGTVQSVDGDPNITGVQVRSVNGKIDFSVTAPDLAKAEVTASATDTPKYIPDYDNTGVSSTMTVTGLNNNVITLSVQLQLEHPRSDDLEIVLQSPKGTKISLETACNPSSGTCSTAKDISTTYPALKKPAKGSVKDFNGQNGNGTWRLSIKDPYYGPKNSKGVVDPGKLISWQLSFNAAAVTSGTMAVTAAHAKSSSCKASLAVAYNATPITKTVAEDFTSGARNDTAISTAHWDTGLGRIDPFPADFGTGRDGDLNVNSGTYNLNLNAQSGRLFPDAVAFTVTALGANSATLKGGVGGLVIGDEVLLINMQGGTSTHKNVGNYEIKKIAKIDFASNKLFFATSLTRIYGATSNSSLSGQKVVVQRVPHYRNVYIKGTLTADYWDGIRGGVLFFKASGTVQILGTVTMSNRGYRAYSNAAGESYHGGYKVVDTNGALGAGSMSSTVKEVICSGGSTSGYYYRYLYNYGGGGGYGTAGKTSSTASDSGSCSGKSTCYQNKKTAPGAAYGDKALKALFLGSAGATGYYCRWRCRYGSTYSSHSHSTTYGGNGGGIIVIWGGGISVTGSIQNSGSGGGSYSGGGSGGTIFLRARSMNVGNKRVTAKGSTNAGAGRVRLDFFGLSGISDPPHYAGFSGKTVAVTKNLNFTTKTLLSAKVSFRIEDLRGGSVEYALSPNGGKSWTVATPGKDIIFTDIGSDLRLKVSFTNKSLDPLSLMGVVVSFKNK